MKQAMMVMMMLQAFHSQDSLLLSLSLSLCFLCPTLIVVHLPVYRLLLLPLPSWCPPLSCIFLFLLSPVMMLLFPFSGICYSLLLSSRLKSCPVFLSSMTGDREECFLFFPWACCFDLFVSVELRQTLRQKRRRVVETQRNDMRDQKLKSHMSFSWKEI